MKKFALLISLIFSMSAIQGCDLNIIQIPGHVYHDPYYNVGSPYNLYPHVTPGYTDHSRAIILNQERVGKATTAVDYAIPTYRTRRYR